ncbi:uncharacterized protein V1518DRAFT_243858 [Limtongia smithiae]|uniref:uncharacterized protein n=1 Tax=Limtongia smithiae TaxID=1125753 RepID=UPI0034CD76F7
MAPDYVTLATWAMFFSVFVVTALYATRKRWESFARSHISLYNYLVPMPTRMRGRAGAGYMPGNAQTGALPMPSSFPLASTMPSQNTGGGFQEDLESGLSSETFDLGMNVAAGDTRRGLADDSKLEIQRIMRESHVGFDEARVLYTARALERNGIGADGRPRDPRAVFFS